MMFSFVQLLFSSSVRFCKSSSTSASDSGIVPQVLCVRFKVGLDTSDGARSSYIDQCIKSYCLGEGTACKFMTKLFLYGFKGKLAESYLFCRLDRNSNIYPFQGNQIHTFVNCTLKL